MSNSLWTKNGKLISNDGGTNLLECPTCPCDGMTIELNCPDSLHTLGEGKPFSITVTYAFPSAASVLPSVTIEFDYTDSASYVSLVAENGSAALDFTNGWTGILGTDKTLTFDAGNIMAVGTIREDEGVTRNCNATITVWDPHKVDTAGDPLEPVECVIPLWDDITCSITAPSSECDGNEFSASLTTSGTGAAGNLVRMDSDTGIFQYPQNRFVLHLNGIDVGPEAKSKWTDGVWEGTGLTNSDLDTMKVALDEYDEELCYQEIEVKRCGISNITITCPECLHTLGDGGELIITVTYTDINEWSDTPDISITDMSVEGGAPATTYLTDEGTGDPPDFTTGWQKVGDTKTWSSGVRINSVPGEARSLTLSIEVTSDRYVDDNNNKIIVECSTYISDIVTCDGVTITSMNDSPCTGGHLNIRITAKGDCGGGDTADLILMNSGTPPDLFGSYPPHRFNLEIAGDYEMVEDNGWVEGVYDSLIKMTGVKDELGVIEDIEVTLSEYGEELCHNTFTPVPCEVEATIECPDSLHTLGSSKWLTITLTYTDPDDYAPLLEVELYSGTNSYSAAAIGFIMEDEIGGTAVATFGEAEWYLAGNTRTWRHKVQINSMPAGWDDGDVISIRVIMDYEGPSGEDVTGAYCDIALHYKVECDGEAILPDSGCVNETQDATITVKGTNGDDLVRMDYTENSGLFGSNLQFYRFKVAISGGGTQPLTPEGYSIHENWVQGVWSCLEALGGGITPNSYTGDPVHITFEDAENTPNLVCEAEMTVEECGCTVEIDCPLNLHVYGDAKTLTITINYTDPDLNDTHPRFYIEMAAVGDPLEEIYDEDGLLDLSDSPGSLNWTWYGNTKVWQKFIHINNVEHVDGKTDVTIRATHINSEGVEENLDTCKITLSALINCTISGLPSDSCVDADDGTKTVGFSISVTGDPSETLTDWDPSPGGRFTITTSLPLPEGVSLYSGWTNGKWSVSEIEAGPGEHSVTLYDQRYPTDGCHEEFTLYDCTMTATISGCPVTIHSLGDGAEITITVYYASYDFYHPDATVSITGNAATWSGGGWVADAGAGTKTMTGTLTGVLNAEGTMTLEVKDPDGNLLADCVVTIVNGVACDVSFDPEQACLTTEEFPVTVTVVITVTGEGDIPLTRFSSHGGRFSVDYAGLTGAVTNESWSGTSYTATIPSEAYVIVALSDSVASADICFGIYEAADCSVTGELSCPTILHTLGEAKAFGITVTYTEPDLYTGLPTIEIYCPGDSTTPNTECVTMTGSWGAVNGAGERAYTGTIAATCIPGSPTVRTSDIRVMLLDPRTLAPLDTCWINITEELVCTITVIPATECILNYTETSVCRGDEFTLDIAVEPAGYEGSLPYLESRGNLVVTFEGDYTNPGCSLSSGWVSQHWICNGLTATGSSLAVSLYQNGGPSSCHQAITVNDCSPEITASGPSLMMYQDGDILSITITDPCKDYTSTSELIPGNISISWGLPPGASGNGFTALEMQWPTRTLSFTDRSLWSVQGGKLVWQNTIRPTNSCTPGTYILYFQYALTEASVGYGTAYIEVDIGSMSGHCPSLHIWGEAKELSITVQEVQNTWFNAALLSVETAVDGDSVYLSDHLRVNSSTYISFASGWNINGMSSIWQEDIISVGSEPETVDLEFTYGKMEPYTLQIDVEAEVTGHIAASPRRRKIGDVFTVTAYIRGVDGQPVPSYPGPKSVTYTYMNGDAGTISQSGSGWDSDMTYIQTVSGSAMGDIEALLTYTQWDNSENTASVILEIVPDVPVIDITDISTLHIYGGGKSLSIVVDHIGASFPFSFSAAADRYLTIDYDFTDEAGASVSASVGDVLEMYNGGQWVDMSFGSSLWTSGETWEFDTEIRAKSSTSVRQVAITFKVWYYDVNNSLQQTTASLMVSISDALNVDVSAPGSAEQGDYFTVSITVNSPNGDDLPRLPSGVISVSHSPTDTTILDSFKDNEGDTIVFSGFDEGTVSRTGRVMEECVYKFVSSYQGEVLDSTFVTIKPLGPFNVSHIIEACNERAKNTNIDAYLSPSTTITWSNRSVLSNHATTCLAAFVTWGSGTVFWTSIDKFEEDLQNLFTSIKQHHTLTTDFSRACSYTRTYEYRRVRGSCNPSGSWAYSFKTLGEALAFVRSQYNYTLHKSSGGTLISSGGWSTSHQSRYQCDEDATDPCTPWAASRDSEYSAHYLEATSKSWTTVPMVLRGTAWSIREGDHPFSSLGQRIPVLRTTDESEEYELRLGPGGSSGQLKYGSAEFRGFVSPSGAYECGVSTPITCWKGKSSGYGGIRINSPSEVEFFFKYRN